MEKLVAYIPMDRRHAIARGETLPDRAQGSALFADISGFTPLTETLVRELGPQRGAEELTNYLNLVYDALIEDVHHYGGSIIAFAGDAITCWLDGDNGRRATNCALAMQTSMQQFSAIETAAGSKIELSMKTAVATGPVRRFLVGDPAIRILDAIAGATLTRLASAEHQAQKGEVIIDQATLHSVADCFTVTEMRTDPETALRFAVVTGPQVTGPQGQSVASPWPVLDRAKLTATAIRPWLLLPVYERINRGLEEFLAELRPTVALFLRFGGIDYDGDTDAGKKLNAYFRWVQSIVAQYEGTLIDLNIGDKGSYIYINFGAPLAHENNAARAASTALALRNPPADFATLDPVQIGLSQGRMRAGVYGGTSHRTYGVLGDEVNMAARLMMKAKPGQILVSEGAQQSIADAFLFKRLPPMHIRGKRDAVAVYALTDRHTSTLTHAASYALPMVGRTEELAQFMQLLTKARQGDGQIVLLSGEAGVGKSRLVAEIVQRAEQKGWKIHSGACESYGSNSSYLVWHPIWRGLLGVNAKSTNAERVAALTEILRSHNPSWLQRLPLLDVILQLPIPENSLSRSLDAKLRKASLHYLLIDLFRAQTTARPSMIVLEDCDWLDPLSDELLQAISHVIAEQPVCIVIAYRELLPAHTATIAALPNTTQLHLKQFQAAEATKLIALKLDQLSGGQFTKPERTIARSTEAITESFTESLIARLVEQSQGNPFYLEELATYLYYQGISRSNSNNTTSNNTTQADLPDSLHRLVLSRLDQLTESQKITARVASVIGRVFRAAWLWGAYPSLGDPEQVHTDLMVLQQQDLTMPEAGEPELTYLFKQVITQSVTYESLPFAMRSTIHDQIGQFIEQRYEDTLEQYLNLLAHHYEHSENSAKRREYLLRAAEAAQAQYANQSAIDYYRRVLPLLLPNERVDVQRKLGQVLELTGEWQAAEHCYLQGLAEAQKLNARSGQAWCETAIGELFRKQGQYDEAMRWLEQAQAKFEDIDNLAGLGQVLHYKGTMAVQQGDYENAQTFYSQSLSIRQQIGDQQQAAYLLGNMGIVARRQGKSIEARSLYEESLLLRRELGDRWGVANSLNNLGNLLLDQGEFSIARQQLEEAVALQREVGDRGMLGISLHTLGNVARAQQDYPAARTLYSESLTIYHDLGDKFYLAYLLEDLAWLVAKQDQGEPALRLVGAAAALREEINGPLTDSEAQKLHEALAPALITIDQETESKATAYGRAMSLDAAVDYALTVGCI